jgi:hypothetical protein
MFFIREGFLDTNSFHSSGSIFPSPFKSASLNVCGKKGENRIINQIRMKQWNLTQQNQIVPCQQLFQQHHQTAIDPIHAELPIPSPSTV